MEDWPAKLLAGEYFVQALNLKANSCATLRSCTDHFLQQKHNLESSQYSQTSIRMAKSDKGPSPEMIGAVYFKAKKVTSSLNIFLVRLQEMHSE